MALVMEQFDNTDFGFPLDHLQDIRFLLMQ
jgi:hypothetical protein